VAGITGVLSLGPVGVPVRQCHSLRLPSEERRIDSKRKKEKKRARVKG